MKEKGVVVTVVEQAWIIESFMEPRIPEKMLLSFYTGHVLLTMDCLEFRLDRLVDYYKDVNF